MDRIQNAKKITLFRPHVEIRIFINQKMIDDWIKCRRYLDVEAELPNRLCGSCELFNRIYPDACSLCDDPEIRKKLKEWTGYGNEYE